MTSRILVVDDDTALAEMIGIVLRTEGFETAFCADGARAVDAWREERPDLILLDVVMPKMDGIEACRRIRAQALTKDIPIIMVTTRSEAANIEASYKNGCNDFVNKPLNNAELLAKVRSFLEP